MTPTLSIQDRIRTDGGGATFVDHAKQPYRCPQPSPPVDASIAPDADVSAIGHVRVIGRLGPPSHET
jgi:hypothetical protein